MAPLMRDNPSSGCDCRDEVEVIGGSVGNFGFSSEDSDDDDDNVLNMGYELLPQDLESISAISSTGSVSTATVIPNGGAVESGSSPGSQETPPFLHPVVTDVPTSRSLQALTQEPEIHCCEGNPTADIIAMDQDQIERIKAAMAGFTLPSSAIPHWASIVPEYEWKEHLLTLVNSGRFTADLQLTSATDKSA